MVKTKAKPKPKPKAELIRFVKEYLVSPKSVGALNPSGRDLAEVVTNAAHLEKADVVVEFGPGTGVFTELILQKIRTGTKFIAIEISADFVKATQQRCPGVQVYHGSATDVRKFLNENGLDHCDAIVSGLPFALFEDELQDAILNAAVDVLKPGGVFVTFTYFQSPYLPQGRKIRRKLHAHFSEVHRTRIVWKNVLPAFAYQAFK